MRYSAQCCVTGLAPPSSRRGTDCPRAIGSIRRECNDHLIVLNDEHVRRILAKFAAYYNEWRPHASLAKDVPNGRPIERFGDIVARVIFGGLHHRYARI
jgi:transposase InsO family protein